MAAASTFGSDEGHPAEEAPEGSMLCALKRIVSKDNNGCPAGLDSCAALYIAEE